jgi:MFS family permease
MTEENSAKKAAHRRLLPLYIAAFFQSFVLWYTIEKLFMQSIGFSNAQIGVMIAVYSAVMLLVDTPAGILADRWSRKGVLILASLSIALSSLVGGLSHSIVAYLACSILWGIFFACYQGTYDSIIYDTLSETMGSTRSFDHFFGRMQLYEGVGLGTSSLLGAFIAASTNLRLVYFLTIPLVLIPIIALINFHEPTLHKQHAVIPLPQQLQATFRAVTRNRSLLPVVTVLVLRATLIYCIFEFDQLWLLALHTSTSYYGIINVVVLALPLGVGSASVGWFKLSKYRRMLATLAVMLLCGLGLIFFRTTAWVVASQAIFASALVGLFVIFSRILHDNIAPSIRAGAASAASTMGRFFIIPVALLIGYLAQKFTIYKAAYVLLILAVMMTLFVIKVASRDSRTGLEPK